MNIIAIIRCYNNLRGQTLHYALGKNLAPRCYRAHRGRGGWTKRLHFKQRGRRNSHAVGPTLGLVFPLHVPALPPQPRRALPRCGVLQRLAPLSDLLRDDAEQALASTPDLRALLLEADRAWLHKLRDSPEGPPPASGAHCMTSWPTPFSAWRWLVPLPDR